MQRGQKFLAGFIVVIFMGFTSFFEAYSCELLKNIACFKLFPCLSGKSGSFCLSTSSQTQRPGYTPYREARTTNTRVNAYANASITYNNINQTQMYQRQDNTYYYNQGPVILYQPVPAPSSYPSYQRRTPSYNLNQPSMYQNYNQGLSSSSSSSCYQNDSQRDLGIAQAASSLTFFDSLTQPQIPNQIPNQNQVQPQIHTQAPLGSQDPVYYQNKVQDSFPLYWTDFLPWECRARSQDVFMFRYNDWDVLALPQGCKMALINPSNYDSNYPTNIEIKSLFETFSYEDSKFSPDYNPDSPFALYPDRTFILHLRYKETKDQSPQAYTHELRADNLYRIVPGNSSYPTRSISIVVLDNIRSYSGGTYFDTRSYNFGF